jgi:ribA/ribD-fused uncharacterized protein
MTSSSYTFFYGSNAKLYPEGCKHYVFSQWYKSDFKDENGTIYKNMEQWMMSKKAQLFGDDVMLSLIMATSNPYEIKKYGRRVSSFDEDIWRANRFNIVCEGNLLKFSQNEELKQILLDTGDSTIVEASPTDRIWGIGLGVEKAKITPEKEWRGLNLLGKALMDVRNKLQ